jgi:hypothetical protein
MKKIGILLYIVLFSLTSFSQISAEEMIKPKKLMVKWELNALGDARVEASSVLDAAGWDYYKKTIGNNPDVLKRMMERTFPGQYLQNFNYKDDAMNRSWTLSFDVLGLSKINSKGLWMVDLNSKDPDVTRLTDHNYVVTSNFAGQGSLFQEIDYINFPVAASNIKQEKNTFGKAIFTYSLTPGGGFGQWLVLALGALLMIAGILMLVLNTLRPVQKTDSLAR